MTIELPGYFTCIPDEFYSKDRVFELERGGQVPATGLLLLKRYTEPTEDRVVSHICETAESVIDWTQDDIKNPDITDLEGMLSKLDQGVLQRIIERDAKIIETIRQVTLAMPVHKGREGIYIGLYYVPTQELAKAQARHKSCELRDFYSTFTNNMTDSNYVLLMLEIELSLEGAMLPPKPIITEHLKFGVINSDIFNCKFFGTKLYPYDELSELFSALYSKNGLTPDNMQLLKRIPDRQKLDEFSMDSAEELKKQCEGQYYATEPDDTVFNEDLSDEIGSEEIYSRDDTQQQEPDKTRMPNDKQPQADATDSQKKRKKVLEPRWRRDEQTGTTNSNLN